MKISIITLFPEMFQGVFEHSINKRAQAESKVEIEFVNLRKFGEGKHNTVDDTPYGGGTGMVLKVNVLQNAILSTKKRNSHVILLDPKGKPYTQSTAERLSKHKHIILVCGRYEGFDERVRNFVDEEISIGDYILSCGEIPAMVITDSLLRLIPGVLKKNDAIKYESFSENLGSRIFEPPVYTKPSIYKNLKVPEILLSGNKKAILDYNTKEAIRITKEKRPELLKS